MRLSVGSNRYTNCPGSNITLSKFHFYDQQELNNPPSVTPRPSTQYWIKKLCFHVSRRAVGIARLRLAVTRPTNCMYPTKVVTIAILRPRLPKPSARKNNRLFLAVDVLQGMRELLECVFTNHSPSALHCRRLDLPQLLCVPSNFPLGFNRICLEKGTSSPTPHYEVTRPFHTAHYGQRHSDSQALRTRASSQK
jgi:hypothetical protein